MSCSITHKEGPRTIVINGFQNVYSAIRYVNAKGIDNYDLKVQPEE